MKHIIPVFMLLGLAVTTLQGQNIVNMPLHDFYNEFRTTHYRDKLEANTHIAGSPYESEEFVKGEIVTTNNIRYSGIPLQLNLFTNQMEFKSEDNQTFYIGVPEMVEYVLIGHDKYIYCPYSYGSKTVRGYVKVLTEGRVSLLQKKNVILKPAEEAKAYQEAIPATYVKAADDFFIRVQPGEAKRITHKKDLAEVLGNYPPEMDAFIKKNKIRFTKAEDLKELMDYYCTLVK